ncbi:MAG: riboflavin synthase [Magnetococcales bacterium]|nr:riboflavin synthase [Magnetococcales bacterium]
MFTGLIAATGTIYALHKTAADWQLTVSSTLDLGQLRLGDSIAVNGVCLTVTAKTAGHFTADLSSETVSATTFAQATVGDPVNLERAMAVGDRLDGHIVQGHVDAVGVVEQVISHGRSWEVWIRIPAAVGRYVIPKGSIAVDGVSLTVNRLEDKSETTLFAIRLIPHTQQRTTLAMLRAGRLVNIETDLLGRYVERLLRGRVSCDTSSTTIDSNYLIKHGII